MSEAAGWDPEEALRSLVDEAVVTGEDEEKQARRVFKESLPMAARAICHIAKYSTSEQTRLRAAQYVVERNLGKVGDDIVNEDNPLERLLGEVVKDMDAIEAHANGS